MTDQMLQTRATAAEWVGTYGDPVLDAGQLGYETDTGILKCGDGVTAWSALDPVGGTGGGGGGGMTLNDLMPRYLQDDQMHATYSDDFVGGPDLSKWTRRTVTAGDETNDVWNGEAGVFWSNVAAGWLYTMPCPAGDFYWHAAVAVESASTTSLVGAAIIDAAGDGRGAFLQGGVGVANVRLAAHVYAAYVGNAYLESSVRHRLEIWAVTIRKSGTNYSVGARRCLPDVAGFNRLPVLATADAWAGAPNRLAIGCAFTDATFSRAALLRANLTT